jgi:chromosome segregation ATPase
VIDDSPQTLLYLVVGAFVGGWLVAKIGAFFGNRYSRSNKRDPRDDRVRSLEADLRVARNSGSKHEATIAERDQQLAAAKASIDEKANTIKDQLVEINRLRADLHDSVKKTHELREELTDRAEENLRSTVKLKQVETELSVVRETSDMLSTGRLDFTTADDDAEPFPNVVKIKS